MRPRPGRAADRRRGRAGTHPEAQGPGLAGGLAASDLAGGQVATGAAVDPGSLLGLRRQALGVELLGRVEAGVEVAAGQQRVDVFPVDRLRARSAGTDRGAPAFGTFVPVELHLAQGAQDLGDRRVGRARRVGVFDTQHEVAAVAAGVEVVVERGARPAEVEVAGGGRCETDTDGGVMGPILPHGAGCSRGGGERREGGPDRAPAPLHRDERRRPSSLRHRDGRQCLDRGGVVRVTGEAHPQAERAGWRRVERGGRWSARWCACGLRWSRRPRAAPARERDAGAARPERTGDAHDAGRRERGGARRQARAHCHGHRRRGRRQELERLGAGGEGRRIGCREAGRERCRRVAGGPRRDRLPGSPQRRPEMSVTPRWPMG